MNTSVLFHTPDLGHWKKQLFRYHQNSICIIQTPAEMYTIDLVQTYDWIDKQCSQHCKGSYLKSHIIRTRRQQVTSWIPFDCINFILETEKKSLILVFLAGWSCRKWEDEQTGLTVCPWNVLMGRSWPSLQTWMHMSVLQEANVLLLCQSTSRAGAEVRGRKGYNIRACLILWTIKY